MRRSCKITSQPSKLRLPACHAAVPSRIKQCRHDFGNTAWPQAAGPQNAQCGDLDEAYSGHTMSVGIDAIVFHVLFDASCSSKGRLAQAQAPAAGHTAQQCAAKGRKRQGHPFDAGAAARPSRLPVPAPSAPAAAAAGDRLSLWLHLRPSPEGCGGGQAHTAAPPGPPAHPPPMTRNALMSVYLLRITPSLWCSCQTESIRHFHHACIRSGGSIMFD